MAEEAREEDTRFSDQVSGLAEYGHGQGTRTLSTPDGRTPGQRYKRKDSSRSALYSIVESRFWTAT